jgi:DNA-binding IclR family transcriptional regulator
MTHESRGLTEGAQSLRRAVAILRILASGQERGVRLTDIVAQTGLRRPTVHRILKVLAEEGAAEQDAETRRYLIGAEVPLLGLARTARFPIRAVADPYLRELADALGDTVFLTIRNGLDSICIDRKTGSYPIKVLSLEIGARRPLGSGVSGIAILAGLTSSDASAIIKANAKRFAAHDLTAAKVTERVRAARNRGHAYAEAGLVKGTRAIAVVIPGSIGEPLAAISVAAIASRLGSTRAPIVVSAMNEQVAQISRRLAAIAKSRRKP